MTHPKPRCTKPYIWERWSDAAYAYNVKKFNPSGWIALLIQLSAGGANFRKFITYHCKQLLNRERRCKHSVYEASELNNMRRSLKWRRLPFAVKNYVIHSPTRRTTFLRYLAFYTVTREPLLTGRREGELTTTFSVYVSLTVDRVFESPCGQKNLTILETPFFSAKKFFRTATLKTLISKIALFCLNHCL